MIQTFQAPSLKTRTHSYHTWRRARNKRQGKWIRWPRVPEMPGDCSHGPPSEVLLQLLGSAGPLEPTPSKSATGPGEKFQFYKSSRRNCSCHTYFCSTYIRCIAAQDRHIQQRLGRIPDLGSKYSPPRTQTKELESMNGRSVLDNCRTMR